MLLIERCTKLVHEYTHNRLCIDPPGSAHHRLYSGGGHILSGRKETGTCRRVNPYPTEGAEAKSVGARTQGADIDVVILSAYISRFRTLSCQQLKS